nr:MAG TPA: hypothetical protein [Caudoviricetes sp.]
MDEICVPVIKKILGHYLAVKHKLVVTYKYK